MPGRTPSRCVAAIDLGSSGVRCAVYDLRGRTRGFASAPLPVRSPRDLAPLGKELSPQALWALICRLLRQAIQEAGISPRDILAVAGASQREGVALLSEDGQELYLGPNVDFRAFFEGQAIDALHKAEVCAVTGHTPSLLLAPAKVLWFKENRPDVLSRMRWVTSLDGWLALKLTGGVSLEQSAGVEIGLVDFRSGQLAGALLQKIGPAAGLVPPLYAAGEILGKVTGRAARATGLAPGIPVAAAGPDTQCALLGMGLTSPGDTGVVAGWSLPLQMVLDRPFLDSAMRTWSGRHAVEGLWVLESNAGDAGEAYRWARGILFPGVLPEQADVQGGREAAKVPPGANGALAFLGPRLANMKVVGPAMGGFLFPLLSILQAPKRSDFMRAALENAAFAVRANLEQVQAIAGREAGLVALGGGMAANPLFARICSAILGRGLSVTPLATAAGAAMCAAVAAGACATLSEASVAMKAPSARIPLDPALSLEYGEPYRRWMAAREALESLGQRL